MNPEQQNFDRPINKATNEAVRQVVKKKHQEQILFNEPTLLSQATDSVDEQMTQQIIFDKDEQGTLFSLDESHDAITTEQRALQQFTDKVKPSTKTKSAWLWRLIIGLFSVILCIETAAFFIEGFKTSPIITTIYAALLTSLALVSFRALWQEFVGLRQFTQQQSLRGEALRLLLPDSGELKTHLTKPINIHDAETFCQKLSDSLPFDNVQELDEWRQSLSVGLSQQEVMQLYVRIVLHKVDERALKDVAKFSTEAVVLVALSPVAIIDMLVMLSRNLGMINKIAGLYGLKLGYWSRIKLIKQVFVNMAYAGTSEMISDFGSNMIGAELLGKLSVRIGQGLGAGILTARLGVQTMQLCRPIPFDEKPKLNQIRKKITEQIKVLTSLS